MAKTAAAILATGLAAASVLTPAAFASDEMNASANNTSIVETAFRAWADGTGGPYTLLHDDVRWTIAGRSLAAGIYPSREDFMRDVIRPFNARMKEPLKPVVRKVYSDGDTVILLFDAKGVATDGAPYENSYAWFLTLRDGRITEAVAFFDSIAFDDLWTRVKPEA